MSTDERPARRIPPLVFKSPDCPLCDREVDEDGDGYTCGGCGGAWPTGYDRPGTIESDSDRCEAECAPWADSAEWPILRGHRYRCVLDENHEGRWHVGTRTDRDDRPTDVHSWWRG